MGAAIAGLAGAIACALIAVFGLRLGRSPAGHADAGAPKGTSSSDRWTLFLVCGVAVAGLLSGPGAAGPAAATSRTGAPIPGEVVFVTFSSSASAIQVWRAGSGLATVFSSGREISFPRLSPDGRRIAFGLSGANGRESSLYVVRSDGTGLRKITTGRPFDEDPAWSPDGTKIAFSSSRSGNWDIWVKNLVTGAVTRLTRSRAVDWEPAWSPDGHDIAFASKRTGHFNIWQQNLATGRLRELTVGEGDNQYPAWSPDGRRIAFASLRTGAWNVWVKALAHGPEVRITTGDSVHLFPAWSPDGQWIAFESDPHGATFNIFLKKVSWPGLIKITNNTSADSTDPDWGSR